MSQHSNPDELVTSEDPLHVNRPYSRSLNLAMRLTSFGYALLLRCKARKPHPRALPRLLSAGLGDRYGWGHQHPRGVSCPRHSFACTVDQPAK